MEREAGRRLLFVGGTGGRRPGAGPLISAVTAALPALTKSLALELAPVRVNLIAPGFVDTPLSAAILGDQLDARREPRLVRAHRSQSIRPLPRAANLAAVHQDWSSITSVSRIW